MSYTGKSAKQDQLKELGQKLYVNGRKMVKVRYLDTDSPAYSLVGKKCYFCGSKVTPEDCMNEQRVMASQQGNVAHLRCYLYVMAKYPRARVVDLENKVNPQDAIWWYRDQRGIK